MILPEKRAAVISAGLILLIASCLIAAGAAVLAWMTVMPGSSYRGVLPLPAASERELAERLRRHVVAIASEEHNVAHYQKLEQAAAYLERVLTGYGYKVRRQEFDSSAGKVRNLEVSIARPSVNRLKLPVIVVGAHYDSAPGAPGANDNGTGAAAVVELARLLKEPEWIGDYELKLVLFVNEEPPYFKTTQMGSWVHAADLAANGRQVAAMLVLETIGFYSDGKGSQAYPFPFNLLYPDTGNFIGFVGNLQSRKLTARAISAFRRHALFPSEGVAAPASIPGIDWSDHWAYWQHDYPAVMVTDTALFRYPHYHTDQDTPDKIDYERLARVVGGLHHVVRELAGRG